MDQVVDSSRPTISCLQTPEQAAEWQETLRDSVKKISNLIDDQRLSYERRFEAAKIVANLIAEIAKPPAIVWKEIEKKPTTIHEGVEIAIKQARSAFGVE